MHVTDNQVSPRIPACPLSHWYKTPHTVYVKVHSYQGTPVLTHLLNTRKISSKRPFLRNVRIRTKHHDMRGQIALLFVSGEVVQQFSLFLSQMSRCFFVWRPWHLHRWWEWPAWPSRADPGGLRTTFFQKCHNLDFNRKMYPINRFLIYAAIRRTR